MSEASEAERAAIVQWAATWRRAGEALEERRRDRLSTMTLEEMRNSIQAIFSGWNPPPPRVSSGLVEMQRVFARLR